MSSTVSPGTTTATTAAVSVVGSRVFGAVGKVVEERILDWQREEVHTTSERAGRETQASRQADKQACVEKEERQVQHSAPQGSTQQFG